MEASGHVKMKLCSAAALKFCPTLKNRIPAMLVINFCAAFPRIPLCIFAEISEHCLRNCSTCSSPVGIILGFMGDGSGIPNAFTIKQLIPT